MFSVILGHLAVYLVVAIVFAAIGHWLGVRGLVSSAVLRAECQSVMFLDGKPYYIVPERRYIEMSRYIPESDWKSVGDEFELGKDLKRAMGQDDPG